MAYFVEFPSIKRPGTLCSTEYDTLTEALQVAAIHRDQGKFPAIRCDDVDGFTAFLVSSSRWAQPVRLEWSLKFIPNGVYKSIACRKAEHAGVRYASHRKGYRASQRAMRAFAAEWDSFSARLAA